MRVDEVNLDVYKVEEKSIKQLHPNGKDNVFLLPFCKEFKIKENEEEFIVPKSLMVSRYDGCFGFIGGTVDKGEDLISALVRECREEMNLDLDLARVKYFKNYVDKTGAYNHSFLIEVNQKELIEMTKGFYNAQAIGYEVDGFVLPTLVSYDKNKGLLNFLANKFKGTSERELIDLVAYNIKSERLPKYQRRDRHEYEE